MSHHHHPPDLQDSQLAHHLRQQLRLSQALGSTRSAPAGSLHAQFGSAVSHDYQPYQGGLHGSTGAMEQQGDRPFPAWMTLRQAPRAYEGVTQEECEAEAGQTSGAVSLPPECMLSYWHRPGFSVCEVGAAPPDVSFTWRATGFT
jgi:hypothetical protein